MPRAGDRVGLRVLERCPPGSASCRGLYRARSGARPAAGLAARESHLQPGYGSPARSRRSTVREREGTGLPRNYRRHLAGPPV